MPPRGQPGVGQLGKQALLTQDPTPDNGKDQRLRQQGAGYLDPGWGPQETSVYALGWPVSPGAPPEILPPAQAHDSQAVRKRYGYLGRTGNQGPYT